MLTLLERRDEVQRELVTVVLAGGDLTAVVARLRDLIGGAVLATTSDGRVLGEVDDVGEAGAAGDVLTALHASPAFHTTGRFRS